MKHVFDMILNICFPSCEGNGVVKNGVNCLIRGRKSIGVTQSQFSIQNRAGPLDRMEDGINDQKTE